MERESVEQINSKLVISQAIAGDSAKIYPHMEEVRRWLRERGLDQWTEPFAPTWIENQIALGQYFVAYYNGELAATFRLMWADPDYWGEDDAPALYLHTLAVNSTFSGKGVGAQILGWAENYARQHDKPLLRLDTTADNPFLVSFYEKAGFSHMGFTTISRRRIVLLEKKVSP